MSEIRFTLERFDPENDRRFHKALFELKRYLHKLTNHTNDMVIVVAVKEKNIKKDIRELWKQMRIVASYRDRFVGVKPKRIRKLEEKMNILQQCYQLFTKMSFVGANRKWNDFIKEYIHGLMKRSLKENKRILDQCLDIYQCYYQLGKHTRGGETYHFDL